MSAAEDYDDHWLDGDFSFSPDPDAPALDPCHAAADEYAAYGWRVVPIAPGEKYPALTEWQNKATTDPDTIHGWWTGPHAGHGVGIATGQASGVWVLDVDDLDALRDLQAEHGPLPDTLTSVTGSGGLHLFFRYPTDGREITNANRLPKGLDVRGNGGQVVAAPTIHPNGQEYAWEVSSPGDPVDAPDWLLDLVTVQPQAPREARTTPAQGDRPGDLWTAATDWADILTPDGWSFCWEDNTGERYWARPGKEPRRGNHSATTDHQGSDVLKIFTSSMRHAGLVEEETYSKFGYLAATRFGGDHSAAARWLTAQGWTTNTPTPAPTVPAAVDLDTGEVITPQVDGLPTEFDDTHLSDLFGSHIRGRFLYVAAWRRWLEWDGKRWAHDEQERIYEECRQWVLTTSTAMLAAGVDSKSIGKMANYRNRSRQEALVTMARRLDGIAASATEFDTDPDMLNAQNGTVDLRTGQLHPHDPDRRMTKITGADYDPEAVHDDIATVLAVVEPDVRDWLQVVVGYAATGRTDEDILPVFDGGGGNGKTTLLEATGNALGDYAEVAPRELVVDTGRAEHPAMLADLKGRRLVTIEETPENGALRMEQLKALTGGTPIKARYMGQNWFQFDPTHTLIIATNFRPKVNSTDYAAWRRLRLVPFPYTFKPDTDGAAGPGVLQRDHRLRSRVKTGAPQARAMLAWIVQGAVRWHTEGIGTCPTVEAATAQWREEEDVILRFIEDKGVTFVPTSQTRSSTLFDAYRDWCADEQRPAMSGKNFTQKFGDHEVVCQAGVVRHRESSGVVWRGVFLHG